MGSTLVLAGLRLGETPITIQFEVSVFSIWMEIIHFSGYFLCFAVAMGFVMIANLNAIGIVASNFFLARWIGFRILDRNTPFVMDGCSI